MPQNKEGEIEMTDLKKIIKELNRRREKSSLISTLFVVKMLEEFMQELQKEADWTGQTDQARAALRRVIGEKAKVP